MNFLLRVLFKLPDFRLKRHSKQDLLELLQVATNHGRVILIINLSFFFTLLSFNFFFHRLVNVMVLGLPRVPVERQLALLHILSKRLLVCERKFHLLNVYLESLHMVRQLIAHIFGVLCDITLQQRRRQVGKDAAINTHLDCKVMVSVGHRTVLSLADRLKPILVHPFFYKNSV
jgi:hypothetical protein